ncbi:hypothetical protein Agub_g13766, partial [Astrephomene gubernaculifera]
VGFCASVSLIGVNTLPRHFEGTRQPPSFCNLIISQINPLTSTIMTDKADIALDVTTLCNVDPAVLSGLRVGQRLFLSTQGEQTVPSFCTEAGVQLAPLSDPNMAVRFPNPKVIIRAIKRDAGSGAIQSLQVRLYRADDAGPSAPGPSTAAAASSAGTVAAPIADDAGDGALADEECEYKLRKAQYQALAEDAELQKTLADSRLQEALRHIDSAPDREKALKVQLENPGFQGFVSQILSCLDPDRVPATAATVAAVAMATK